MKKKIIYKGATYILAGRYRLEVKYPAKNDWDEKIEKLKLKGVNCIIDPE